MYYAGPSDAKQDSMKTDRISVLYLSELTDIWLTTNLMVESPISGGKNSEVRLMPKSTRYHRQMYYPLERLSAIWKVYPILALARHLLLYLFLVRRSRSPRGCPWCHATSESIRFP